MEIPLHPLHPLRHGAHSQLTLCPHGCHWTQCRGRGSSISRFYRSAAPPKKKGQGLLVGLTWGLKPHMERPLCQVVAAEIKIPRRSSLSLGGCWDSCVFHPCRSCLPFLFQPGGGDGFLRSTQKCWVLVMHLGSSSEAATLNLFPATGKVLKRTSRKAAHVALPCP